MESGEGGGDGWGGGSRGGKRQTTVLEHNKILKNGKKITLSDPMQIKIQEKVQN